MVVDVLFSPILVIICHLCNPSQTTKRRVKNVAIFIRRSRWWQPSLRSFNIHVIPMMNSWWFGSPRRADEVGSCRISIALVFQNPPVIPSVCRSLEPLKAEPPNTFAKGIWRTRVQQWKKTLLFRLFFCRGLCYYTPGWWFQTFFVFVPTWGNDPVWLIFFTWVETTN